ncbi:hypothetical protein GQ54DRAFT_51445 [Martensiomyces pterosporus]|nr:hypothetical protein GQ54DRAFT_51445 [Martensiomyces pterosporus]
MREGDAASPPPEMARGHVMYIARHSPAMPNLSQEKSARHAWARTAARAAATTPRRHAWDVIIFKRVLSAGWSRPGFSSYLMRLPRGVLGSAGQSSLAQPSPAQSSSAQSQEKARQHCTADSPVETNALLLSAWPPPTVVVEAVSMGSRKSSAAALMRGRCMMATGEPCSMFLRAERDMLPAWRTAFPGRRKRCYSGRWKKGRRATPIVAWNGDSAWFFWLCSK